MVSGGKNGAAVINAKAPPRMSPAACGLNYHRFTLRRRNNQRIKMRQPAICRDRLPLARCYERQSSVAQRHPVRNRGASALCIRQKADRAPAFAAGTWMTPRCASAAPGPAPSYEGDDRTDQEHNSGRHRDNSNPLPNPALFSFIPRHVTSLMFSALPWLHSFRKICQLSISNTR